jgi:hypothetical protein
VGVSALFTPDEDVFAAGWTQLLERHLELVSLAKPPRRRVLDLARKLLRAAPAAETESDTSETRAWDPERVARHVERALVQAYRSYRRAHFLPLLHDCDVVYREPAASRARVLEVRRGSVVTSRELPADYVPAMHLREERALREPFDRAKYERLRVLTTELKRIHRDGGSVAVYWGPRRQLPSRWLAGILGAT